MNFLQKLQALMNEQKCEKGPEFCQKVSDNLFELYFAPAARKLSPSVNIEWDVLLNMVGGNHGDADAVIQYLEKQHHLTVTNAVPSGEVICFRWGKTRPLLKY